MFYFKSFTTGKKHPNSEDRLTWILEKLQKPDNDYCWAIACVGLELWAEQFQLYFDWSKENTANYKNLYYDIIKQIKSNQKE